MNQARRTLLKRKTLRLLVSAFSKLLALPIATTIEVEMSWPPGDDSICFRAEIDKRQTGWRFSIPTAHWQLATDSIDEYPDDLYLEIKHLCRTAWREAKKGTVGVRCYLRMHDSTWSVDLATGREVWDTDRPDFIEPDRRPFTRTEKSTGKKPRNGELVRRGDALSAVKKAYKTDEEPDAKLSQYNWRDRGIRIQLDKGKVQYIGYFPPFSESICGIWIGALAWEVDRILGSAKNESFDGKERLWQYDVDGFMSVGFDRHDSVRFIGR